MRVERVLLGLLLSTDLLFIAVHVVHTSTGYLSSPLNSLELDRGHAEYFQYTKLYWLVLLMGLLAVRRRGPVYAGWLAVFAYLLVDDAFSLHETGGVYLATVLGFAPAFGLRSQDFGELVVVAVAGAGVATVIGLGYRLSGADGRALSRDLVLLLGALFVVGVVVDMIHQRLSGSRVEEALAVVEDGGEMVVVSLMVWMVVRALAGPPAAAAIARTESADMDAPSTAPPRS